MYSQRVNRITANLEKLGYSWKKERFHFCYMHYQDNGTYIDIHEKSLTYQIWPTRLDGELWDDDTKCNVLQFKTMTEIELWIKEKLANPTGVHPAQLKKSYVAKILKANNMYLRGRCHWKQGNGRTKQGWYVFAVSYSFGFLRFEKLSDIIKFVETPKEKIMLIEAKDFSQRIKPKNVSEVAYKRL